MFKALRLAKRGRGWTNPHPMVGAVIVKNGKIAGFGYHRKFGMDHAEADALKRAVGDLMGATMYVTVEPCHLPYDLAGPRISCVEIIKNAGIKKVHIAMLDSNPEVSGYGRIRLEKVGVRTTFGLVQKEASTLNEAYHHFMTTGRPFVVVTYSASLDGKIATSTGDSKWITGEKARSFARDLRGVYQAVLVGINTVLKDDPHLGVRKKSKKDPVRIILDSKLKIPLHSKVLRDENVIIATTNHADSKKQKELEGMGIKVIRFEGPRVPLKRLMQEAAKIPIISILVEGGGEVISSFLDTRLVDKFYIFQAPIIIGGKSSISAVSGVGVKRVQNAQRLKDVKFKRLADDFLITGYPKL